MTFGEYKGISFGNYLEAVNYADYAFGLFINELKEKGLYEDTVIIIFGDHYGMGMHDWDMELFIKEVNPEYNQTAKRVNYANLLCGMKIPGVKQRKYNNLVSKIDIKPTLLELSGIEDNFSLGISMFKNREYACISNGDIITDGLYYYNGSWYNIKTDEEINLDTDVEEEKRQKLLKYIENTELELNISRSILINNLFK